jgi:rSAM/selenodomain-associated transferase 1
MTPPPKPGPNTCAIAVIAKAPRPGHVKTRLQAVLEPEEAAAMGSAFLQDTLGNLVLAGREVSIAPYVAYAPAGEEARFDGLLPATAQLVLADGTHGDAPGVQGFGRVLLDTTRTLLARGYGAVCVLGADSPTLPTALLVRAARLLLSGEADAVLGPADDGGYWLLGMTEPRTEPYAGITWSSAMVADETRARCADAGLSLAELDSWYDVDDREALLRLVREVGAPGHTAAPPYAAPRTTALVGKIGLVLRLADCAA